MSNDKIDEIFEDIKSIEESVNHVSDYTDDIYDDIDRVKRFVESGELDYAVIALRTMFNYLEDYEHQATCVYEETSNLIEFIEKEAK